MAMVVSISFACIIGWCAPPAFSTPRLVHKQTKTKIDNNKSNARLGIRGLEIKNSIIVVKNNNILTFTGPRCPDGNITDASISVTKAPAEYVLRPQPLRETIGI